MRMKKLVISCLTLLCSLSAIGQFSADSAKVIFPLNLGYSFQLPSADMALRFGANHNLSFGSGVKLKSNYLFGAQGSFLFGDNIRESGLLTNMIDDNGQILNTDGDPATILVMERGYTIFGYVGKIIPVAGPNMNSGLMLRLGGGYMRHKIRIETQNDDVPQLEDDNLQGYDRLAAGPAAYLYVGYRHFSNSKLINFHVGYEMIYGFTSPLRAFNFDTESAESGTRNDGLNGLRLSWSFPIYKDKSEKVFFY